MVASPSPRRALTLAMAREYRLSFVDPAHLAAHPDGELAAATRFVRHRTRAAAVKDALRIARHIRSAVHLQAFVKGLFGEEPEGPPEEFNP
jgi:hypothetical protein